MPVNAAIGVAPLSFVIIEDAAILIFTPWRHRDGPPSPKEESPPAAADDGYRLCFRPRLALWLTIAKRQADGSIARPGFAAASACRAIPAFSAVALLRRRLPLIGDVAFRPCFSPHTRARDEPPHAFLEAFAFCQRSPLPDAQLKVINADFCAYALQRRRRPPSSVTSRQDELIGFYARRVDAALNASARSRISR